MPRSLVAALVASVVVSALSVLTAPTSLADDAEALPSSGPCPAPTTVLDRARGALSGTASEATGEPVEATLALRDLFVARPALSPRDRELADAVLARPTQGDQDAYGDGYPPGATLKRRCQGNFCLHWVTTTSDAPPNKAWRDKTLLTMNQVWKREIGRLGYRKPVPDGRRGGNSTFDVYLKDLGQRGLYGYCAPERRKPGTKWQASGYCVLDNDFAEKQYGAPPVQSLRVTAAHEFFHAIQFAYDYGEDPWFMETTATWMEERFADGANDNRQYLPFGQVARPSSSLDVHKPSGFNQYGNWPFFEFLSSHFGPSLVRKIWNKAATFQGAPDHYSINAVAAALQEYGGLPDVFAAYAAANTTPGSSYTEGRHWPKAAVSQRWTLGSGNARRAATFRINHLSSRTTMVKPGTTLSGRRWTLRIVVDGPHRRTSPAAYLTIQRKQASTVRRTLPLDRRGRGATTVAFSSRRVRSVSITLANASTRYDCWQKTDYACQGEPLDDRAAYDLKVRAAKR